MPNQQHDHPQAMPVLHKNHPEADERAPIAIAAHDHKPKYREMFDKFPEGWRSAILTAFHHQKDLGLGGRKFVGSVISPTAWSQLVNGNYPVPESAASVKGIEASLGELVKRGEKLKRELSEAVTLEDTRTIAERFVERPEIKDVRQALKDAKARLKRGLEERVVIVTGATRSGKSWMIKKLQSEQEVTWDFKATGGQRSRFRGFLEGIASAMNLRGVEGKTVDKLETSIMDKLKSVEGVLAIQELQRLSSRALEFLKDLTNHSKVSLMLFMLPRQYDRMKRSTNEDMQQFLGRCVLHVELHVRAELVKACAPALWKRCPDAAKLCSEVAREAEQGGGLTLVREVIEGAELFASKGGPVTAEHINKALIACRRAVPVMGTAARQTFGHNKAA